MEVPAGNTLGVKLSTSEEKMLNLMALQVPFSAIKFNIVIWKVGINAPPYAIIVGSAVEWALKPTIVLS